MPRKLSILLPRGSWLAFLLLVPACNAARSDGHGLDATRPTREVTLLVPKPDIDGGRAKLETDGLPEVQLLDLYAYDDGPSVFCRVRVMFLSQAPSRARLEVAVELLDGLGGTLAVRTMTITDTRLDDLDPAKALPPGMRRTPDSGGNGKLPLDAWNSASRLRLRFTYRGEPTGT
jgi:hypothetical protein